MFANKTTKRIRGNTAATVQSAQEMWRQMTISEALLWEAIRGKRLDGFRFRSQHPLGPFILDFCCPSVKLVIEVDGLVHDSMVEHDEARTEQLEAYGYRVLRFRNEQVMESLPLVLHTILIALRKSE